MEPPKPLEEVGKSCLLSMPGKIRGEECMKAFSCGDGTRMWAQRTPISPGLSCWLFCFVPAKGSVISAMRETRNVLQDQQWGKWWPTAFSLLDCLVLLGQTFGGSESYFRQCRFNWDKCPEEALTSLESSLWVSPQGLGSF